MKKNRNLDRPRSERDYQFTAGACTSYGVAGGSSKNQAAKGEQMRFAEPRNEALWGRQK